MKRLIVSADDFGLTKSISEGTVKACKDGIVTSINLLPTGRAFEESLYLLKELELDGVGAHLALTETSPITDPAKIPSLVTRKGVFHANYVSFFIDLFLGRIKMDSIYLELRNQLDRLKRVGLPINSINSHEHIHMMPPILEIFIKLAKEYDIPFIRYPHGDKLVAPYRLKKILKLAVLGCFGKIVEKTIRESGLRTTDNFIGLLDSGNLLEDVLIRLMEKAPEGTTELVCHPGFLSPEVLERCIFQLNCESELASLTSRRVKKVIEDNGIELVTVSEMLKRSQ